MNLVVRKCPSNKMRFLLAQDAADFARSYGNRTGKRQHPYQCPFCHNWHLTTTKPTDQTDNDNIQETQHQSYLA